MGAKRRAKMIENLEVDPLHRTVLDIGRNLLGGTEVRRLTRKHLKALEGVEMVESLLAELQEPRGNEKKGKRSKKKKKASWMEAEYLGQESLRKALLRLFKSKAGKVRPPHRPEEPVLSNLALMGKMLDLGQVDTEVLLFLLAMQHSEELADAIQIFGEITLTGAARIIAAGICRPSNRVLRSLSRKGRLISSGVVKEPERTGAWLQHLVGARSGVLDLALTPELDRRRFVNRFLPEAPGSSLQWDDFEHVGDGVSLARDVLRATMGGRHRGINLLLYGPTGTGKSELARLLASELAAPLYSASLPEEGELLDQAEERLSSLLMGQRLLARERALLLFDEMEDLFDWRLSGMFGGGARGTARMSKQWFNELLESNPVPTIWISNQVEGIDPAFVRRFSFALEMGKLGPRQRARALQRHLGEGADLSRSEVEELASKYAVSPAQLATAVRVATAISGDGKGDTGTIERLLAPLEKLLGQGSGLGKHHLVNLEEYRLDVLNCDVDLSRLADQIENWSPGRGVGISVCLYGVPGTGKSEYVKYLAHRAGRPLHRHPASDLLNMWVGGTEQRIAAAFRGAESEGAILLFDEADSFLRDRQGAMHSWEVTQVNEFLQQLEAFRGIVACTTNLKDELDAASLRRFVFKIELKPLTPGQARMLLDSTLTRLGCDPVSEDEEYAVGHSLRAMSSLTPGDFAAVVRRITALSAPAEVHVLLAGLGEEIRSREVPGRQIGYTPTGPRKGASLQ